MIKKATIFKAIQMPNPEFKVVAALQMSAFQPCLPIQQISSGWTPPNETELCECINGQLVMQYTTETKKIPADVLKRNVDRRCKEIEALTGRKAWKMRKAEVKQEVIDDLILKAFPKRINTKCWINPINQTVIVDAAPKRATEVANALMAAIDGLVLESLKIQPAASMASWLSGLTVPSFAEIGIDCELTTADESKTKVKYVKHNLQIPEVADHIKSGMIPSSVSLLWGDRVSFTLNDDMSLSKIEFLEKPEIEDASQFEADVYLATTDINALVQDLVEELE